MARAQLDSDGRHQRSERSRAQIVKALFELIRTGDMDPSAARVAEKAGVGLRTVFRHFDDMESLYREMTHEIETKVWPQVLKPFEAGDWKGRVLELIIRRSVVYEEIMSLRLCAMSRRFQSEYLGADHKRIVALERSSINSIVPETVEGRVMLLDMLDLNLCFEAWHRLRRERLLTVADAVDLQSEIVKMLVHDK